VSSHDGIYLLQEAVASYLQTNKATHGAPHPPPAGPGPHGPANGLPIVQAGDFGDRARDHIYIMVEDYTQDPPMSGSFLAQVIVGVATTRETTLSKHQEYCRIIFDLLMEQDLATYLNTIPAFRFRVYQVGRDHSFTLGAISEGLRFTQATFSVRCYLSS